MLIERVAVPAGVTADARGRRAAWSKGVLRGCLCRVWGSRWVVGGTVCVVPTGVVVQRGRLHSELGDLTPAEVETAYYGAPGQARAA